MHSPAHLIRIWIASVVGLLQATLSRLLLGPTLPSWAWRTEWAVAVARSGIAAAASARDDPLVTTIGLNFKTPLSGSIVGTVHIRSWDAGPRSGDQYDRVGTRTPRATILYFHGGGYLFGNPGTHREHVARLVERTGARAISPAYRLAPRYRFPVAVDDATASYRRLLDSGVSPSQLIIAGDSAGGGLALALVHRARSESLPMPAGLMLFSPYVDLTHSSYTNLTNAPTDYLPVSEMTSPNDWYVDADDIDNPEASPLNADLTGFPPMLIHVGAAEMLLSDSIRLAEHAERDGVQYKLLIADEMPHVWPALAPWENASRIALEQCALWIPTVIQDHVAPDGPPPPVP